MSELLFAAAAVFLLAAVVFLVGTLCAHLFVDRLAVGCRKNRLRLITVAYVAMSFAWLAFLCKALLPSGIDYRSLFFAILLLGTAIITLLRLTKAFTIFLVVFLCFSIVRLSYSILDDSRSESEITRQFQHDDYRNIKLIHKPDIYLFILESYHGIEVLNSVYDFDTSNLENYLDANNIVHYPDTYSNSALTLQSLCDLYSMQSYRSVGRGNLDVVQEVRKILGGDKKNTVFSILKKNDYYIENIYLENQSYYLLTQGEYLDRVDRQFFTELDRLSQPIYSINNHIFEKAALFFRRPQILSLSEALDNALAQKPRDKPYFLAVKTGADHTPAVGYTWEQAKEWVASGNYQKMMSKSLAELLPVLSRIIAADPGALIILIGDHGPTRYRSFLPKVFGTDEKIDARCAESGISRQDVADDLFNVFLAIRMPGGRKDISGGYSISHCNLFMHVFSELCQDRALVKKRALSISEEGRWTLVKEGEVLGKWLAD